LANSLANGFAASNETRDDGHKTNKNVVAVKIYQLSPPFRSKMIERAIAGIKNAKIFVHVGNRKYANAPKIEANNKINLFCMLIPPRK
jgi:hypothetical protein